ncbi:MAG: hypothetical protein Q9225_001852 [Loekoesia sp. 1 TL-2023]
MADPFATVAAVVSFVDVTVRACKGIHALIDAWKDAPDTIQRLRQTVQNQHFMLESLRLYMVEYESSKLCVEQNQLLPMSIKNELRDITSDLDLLQQSLPPAGSQKRMLQQLKWVFDEKKVLRVGSRLDSRQIAVMNGLQITTQRNGMKIYEQLSSIRSDLQQNGTATESQLREAQLSISQQLGEAARDNSDKLLEQANMLKSIQTLVEPVADNHAKTMDQLASLANAMRLSEGHLRSTAAFEAPTIDIFRRLLRAELRNVVLPAVEEHLDSYKFSQSAQLEGIRGSLDRIVLDSGNPLLGGTISNEGNDNQESTAGILDSELRDGTCFPRHQVSNEAPDKTFDVLRPAVTSSHYTDQSWSRLWCRIWTFDWPVGVLVVHISAFHDKPSVKRKEFQAFEHSPSLLIARGITLRCESKQDRRGYYQICPMISTFAIVPKGTGVFECVGNNDVAGLQRLFENRLAAPTDRDENLRSPLSLASLLGHTDVCELLLAEGADPVETGSSNFNPLWAAHAGKLFTCYESINRPWPGKYDYESVTRSLIRSGCDLNEAFGYSWFPLSDFIAKQCDEDFWQQIRIWEHCPDLLTDWAEFLRNQGLNVNQLDQGETTWIINEVILHLDSNSCDELFRWELTQDIFLQCLLGADVSVREPETGWQALHFLFGSRRWSAEWTSDVLAIACMLINLGGADLFAFTYDGESPSSLAISNGWEHQWRTALDICGFDSEEVIEVDFERWEKYQRLGFGDSSAVDVEDLVSTDTATITRRKPATGDRLVD